MTSTVKMIPIPISAAKKIADTYGYDQVVVMARKVPEGEHITTYGVNPTHCDVAALMGNTLKRIAQWPTEDDRRKLDGLFDDLLSGTFDYMDYDETVERIAALGRLLGK